MNPVDPIDAALDLLEHLIEKVEEEWNFCRSIEEMRAQGDEDVALLDQARADLKKLRIAR